MTRVRQLGYLGLEVSDLIAWERFAVDVLGLELARRAADGSLALRMDWFEQRIRFGRNNRTSIDRSNRFSRSFRNRGTWN